MYFDFCVLLNADLTTPLVSFVKALPGLSVGVQTMYWFLGEGTRRMDGVGLCSSLLSLVSS